MHWLTMNVPLGSALLGSALTFGIGFGLGGMVEALHGKLFGSKGGKEG